MTSESIVDAALALGVIVVVVGICGVVYLAC